MRTQLEAVRGKNAAFANCERAHVRYQVELTGTGTATRPHERIRFALNSKHVYNT